MGWAREGASDLGSFEEKCPLRRSLLCAWREMRKQSGSKIARSWGGEGKGWGGRGKGWGGGGEGLGRGGRGEAGEEGEGLGREEGEGLGEGGEGEGLKAGLRADGHWRAPERQQSLSGGPPGWERSWSRGRWNPRDVPREEGWYRELLPRPKLPRLTEGPEVYLQHPMGTTSAAWSGGAVVGQPERKPAV